MSTTIPPNRSAPARSAVPPARPDAAATTPPLAATMAAPPDTFGAIPGTPTVAARDDGPLPDVLMRMGNKRVVHGDDPGDFYCEHMFYAAQKTAATLPSIQSNAHGEKLVGFLHCPWDAETSTAPPPSGPEYTQADRHESTREVIGATLRGYFDTAAPGVSGAVKLMVTGYGPFSSARNNPTGDFVRHDQNIDAAMRLAFGDRLVKKTSPSPAAAASGDVRQHHYVVRDANGTNRDVVVQTQWFPVTDIAIDGSGATSVQKSMEAFGAHGIVSMGVHSGRDYLAEHHADDGGLGRNDGGLSHDASRNPSDDLADNFALARAIAAGASRRTTTTPWGSRLDPVS